MSTSHQQQVGIGTLVRLHFDAKLNADFEEVNHKDGDIGVIIDIELDFKYSTASNTSREIYIFTVRLADGSVDYLEDYEFEVVNS